MGTARLVGVGELYHAGTAYPGKLGKMFFIFILRFWRVLCHRIEHLREHRHPKLHLCPGTEKCSTVLPFDLD